MLVSLASQTIDANMNPKAVNLSFRLVRCNLVSCICKKSLFWTEDRILGTEFRVLITLLITRPAPSCRSLDSPVTILKKRVPFFCVGYFIREPRTNLEALIAQ